MDSVEKKVEEKGFFDILLMLDEGAKTFIELKSLGLSPNTILHRLREAQEMGLVQEQLVPQKGKRSQIAYILTAQGKDLVMKYLPVKTKYLSLKEELDNLTKQGEKIEHNMRFLLASVRSPSRGKSQT
mgnify:CR=1 FL=1